MRACLCNAVILCLTGTVAKLAHHVQWAIRHYSGKCIGMLDTFSCSSGDSLVQIFQLHQPFTFVLPLSFYRVLRLARHMTGATSFETHYKWSEELILKFECT